MTGKKVKTARVVAECLSSGITSPTAIQQELAKRGKVVTDSAVVMAIKRSGVDRKALEQKVETERNRDIMEHPRVRDYVTAAATSGTTTEQVNRQLANLKRVWELMNFTPPETWTYTAIIEKVKTIYPTGTDARGRERFNKPSAVQTLLSPVATIFPNIIARGLRGGLSRTAGELKDYFTFAEFDEFIAGVQDVPQASKELLVAIFETQLSGGFREGRKGKTGILGLEWQNINYESRRCRAREKGGKGNAAREWQDIPLDLFPWRHAWDKLMQYHVQKFGYLPTNQHHETGRVFPIDYDSVYREGFHAARRKANGRISGDTETMKPHVLRKTHAQWLVKLKVPLERICGQFPHGRFGVGWDNPLIPLRYYVTLEQGEEIEIWSKASVEMQKLGLTGAAAAPVSTAPAVQ